MENVLSIYDGGEVETPVKGGKTKVFDLLTETYLPPAGIKKSKATEDIPQAVEIEVVRGNDDEREESEIFRRSSLLVYSPPGANDGGKRAVSPIPKVGSLPDMGEFKPVGIPEMLQEARIGRASTPLGKTGMSEGDESVAIVGDLTITQEDAGQMEYDGAREVSSIVLAPSRTHKRLRNTSSESAAMASVTGDEGLVDTSEEKQKKKKCGRPRTIIDKVMDRRAEKEKKKQQVLPATSLPDLSEVTGGLENQPTSDITWEFMQVARTIERVATTSRNLKGCYVSDLRLAALKIYAGTNLLSRRIQEQTGGNTQEALVELRKRNQALQHEKERLEQEAMQTAQIKNDLERVKRDLEEMRKRNRELEREVDDLKTLCAEREKLHSLPPPLRLSIPPRVEGGGGDLL